MRTLIFIATLLVAANLGSDVFAVNTAKPADGSILLVHNSNKLVGASTSSTITHVAMVLTINGRPMVYEATPAKVRKLPLASYYQEIGDLNRNRKKKMRVELSEPRRAFTAKEKQRMRLFLNEQLGRRYSVRGYLREKSPGDGIHCAALVGTALSKSGKCKVVNPNGQSPATLVLGLRSEYRTGEPVAIKTTTPQPTMCERWAAGWDGFKKWCSWSFVETFRFCF